MATAGTTYVVSIDFQTNGDVSRPMRDASEATRRFQEGLDQAKSAAISLGSSAANAFTGLVESVGKLAMVGAAIGGAGLMAGIHSGIIDVNASLETTQSSMAAIFNAQGMSTGGMQGAFKLAGDQMEKMKDDAAALPGDFADLANIMRTVMPSAATMGMNVDDVRKMSGMLMASGAAVGIPMDQVAREAAALMEGRAGADNALGMRLMGLSGDKAQAFNKMDSGDRIKTLTAELGKYGDAIGAISQTYAVLSSTLKDNVQNKILGAATKPLFGVIKEDINSVNEWFTNNKEVVAGWAHSFGTHIVAAYEFGKEKLMQWGPILMTFAGNAYDRISSIVTSLMPIFTKVEGMAKNFFGDPSSIDKIADVLKVYAAIKVGQGAAGPLGDAFGLAKGVGGMLSSGAGGEAMAAVGGMGVAAPVAIAALGGVAAAVYALGKDPEKQAMLSANFSRMSDAFAKLAGSAGTSAMLSFLEKTVDFAGSNTLTGLNLAMEFYTNQMETLNSVFSLASTYVSGLSQTLSDFVNGSLSPMFKDALHGAGTSAADADSSMLFNLNDRIERGIEIQRGYIDYQSDKDVGPAFGMFNAVEAAASKAAADNEKKKGGKAPKSSTNVQKVEIVVSTNADPARIARMVYSEIQNLGRHPKIARNAPRFGA
jgi:hypothetical protein